MTPIEQFRILVEAWCAASGGSWSALSNQLFNRDGSRVARVMGGADLTSTSLHFAVRWISQNWPEGADWPEGVERPAPQDSGSGLRPPADEAAA